MKKVIFFTAGASPTVVEQSQITRLMRTMSVVVRRADVAADTVFKTNNLEASDYVAGSIPTAYNGVTSIAVPNAVGADQFKLFPAAVSLNHALPTTAPETQQLAALAATIDSTSGLASMTDLHADARVTYVSSDTGKATVNSTGKITSVAAGTTNITATYTNDTALSSVTGTAATDLMTKTAHGLNLGDAVLVTFGSGFTGLTTATTYYAVPVDANTFKLATSLANAVAGTTIDITADGTGATVVRAPQTSVCAVTVS